MKTPKIDTAKVRKTVAEITTIILDEGLVEALQNLGQDKTLLAKAKANPRAFLKTAGFMIPPQIDVTMALRRIAFKGPPSQPKGIVPRYTIRICTVFVYTIAKNTPFEHEIGFKICRDYLIW